MGKSENTKERRHRTIVMLSPLLIMVINYLSAFWFGQLIGKWAFIPIILIEWCWFAFFIVQYGGRHSMKRWLNKARQGWVWTLLALVVGFIPLPIFILHKELLAHWTVWVPWAVLAVVNPWLEEFYWRGLLLDNMAGWNKWLAVLFSSLLFAGNHAVFGVNSQLMQGPAIVVVTLIMGLAWAIAYQKTGSLRWVIAAHFLVDFLNLSAPSFLDLYTS